MRLIEKARLYESLQEYIKELKEIVAKETDENCQQNLCKIIRNVNDVINELEEDIDMSVDSLSTAALVRWIALIFPKLITHD